MQVAVRHRRAKALREPPALVDRAAQHHPGAGDDHREGGPAQQIRRRRDLRFVPELASGQDGFGNLGIDHLAEHVPGQVELHRRAVLARALKAAAQSLGDSRRMGERFLVTGDLLETGKLARLLEPAEALGVGAGLRRDHHHRSVVPVGGGDRGHEVGDARAVLRDAYRDLAAGARVAVRHVGRALLVGHVHEADPGAFEHVETRHVGGAHDPEGELHPLHAQGLDEGFLRGHLHGVVFPSAAPAAALNRQ